jgi:hypothetical protein
MAEIPQGACDCVILYYQTTKNCTAAGNIARATLRQHTEYDSNRSERSLHGVEHLAVCIIGIHASWGMSTNSYRVFGLRNKLVQHLLATCWGLVLKCFELRTRQHKMLNVNVLRL